MTLLIYLTPSVQLRPTQSDAPQPNDYRAADGCYATLGGGATVGSVTDSDVLLSVRRLRSVRQPDTSLPAPDVDVTSSPNFPSRLCNRAGTRRMATRPESRRTR